MKKLRLVKFFKIIFVINLCFLISCGNTKKFEYQGYVDGQYIFMASPFSGILQKLNVNEGDFVKKDQVLFMLDQEPQLSQLAQAKFELATAENTLADLEKGQRQTIIAAIEAQIKEAESAIELARLRANRFRMLYEQKAASKDTYDAALTEYNTRVEQLRKLQSDLAEAKLGGRQDVIAAQKERVKAAAAKVNELTWALNQKIVTAPDVGYVNDTFFTQGEFVPENRAVASLLIPSNIYIIFFVPIVDVSKIRMGDKVEVSCEGCKKTYTAIISYISPQVEFTPPVIFSRENSYKYVYRIRALPKIEEAFDFHIGQPVYVTLSKQ